MTLEAPSNPVASVEHAISGAPMAPVPDPVAEAAGGLTQPVAGIADSITEPTISNLAPHLSAADSYLRGVDAGFASAVTAGLSPHEGPIAVAGDPGGIGGLAGSIVDSVIDAAGSLALPAGTAHHASVVALVAALGFTASRLGSAASGLAVSGGGIGLGLRFAWLAAWDSTRCVLASASGLAGASPATLASATSAGFGGFAATQSATGGTSATRVGGTVRSLFGKIAPVDGPEGSSFPGLRDPAWSFGRLLRGLLLLAGGLLALAVFPIRHRGQMAASPVRRSLAVMAISILLAMGVVLLLAA